MKINGHIIGDAEVESFMANIGSQTTYVADKRFATRPNIEWALLADGIAVAVPEGHSMCIMRDDGSVTNIDNEEIWT